MKKIASNDFTQFYFSQVRFELPVDEKYKENIPHYILAANAQAQITNAFGCIYVLQ